jgi:hypothetical protein
MGEDGHQDVVNQVRYERLVHRLTGDDEAREDDRRCDLVKGPEIDTRWQ